MSNEADRLRIVRGMDWSPPNVWPCWWGLFNAAGDRSAMLRCPHGHVSSLTEHKIDDAGRVFPAVSCPDEACDFHEEWIVLDAWNITYMMDDRKLNSGRGAQNAQG